MNFKATFTQSLPVTLRSRRYLILNQLKQRSNGSWNEQGQIIYKDNVIENSNFDWFAHMDDQAEIKQYLSNKTLYDFNELE